MNYELKGFIAKIVSFLLIGLGVYQILISLNDIFFVFPHLNPSQSLSLPKIKVNLIEKAVLLYATMVFDGIYGVVLLLKPSEKIRIINLMIGIFLTIVSIFFITKI